MFILYKDDKKIMESESDWEIVKYIHKNTSHSMSHAIQYENYHIYADKVNISANYLLPSRTL
jgi:glutaredoxin 2